MGKTCPETTKRKLYDEENYIFSGTVCFKQDTLRLNLQNDTSIYEYLADVKVYVALFYTWLRYLAEHLHNETLARMPHLE
jgi:hypothetical protein